MSGVNRKSKRNPVKPHSLSGPPLCPQKPPYKFLLGMATFHKKNKPSKGQLELEMGIDYNSSYHRDFDSSAYIEIRNLNQNLTEGDIISVFSQYGEIIDCHLIRDPETGKSRSVCFICYMDQKSTVLAVDNFNGIQIAGRAIAVEHAKKYTQSRFKSTQETKDPNRRTLNEFGLPQLYPHLTVPLLYRDWNPFEPNSKQLKLEIKPHNTRDQPDKDDADGASSPGILGTALDDDDFYAKMLNKPLKKKKKKIGKKYQKTYSKMSGPLDWKGNPL